MKKIKYFLALLTGLLFLSSAQSQKDSSGIYKTADDYKLRKLSFAINYKTEKHKIKTDIFLKGAEMKVKHNGETFTLLKSETYGYKSTKGEEFRFVDTKEYKIINPGETLLIYVFKHPSNSPKETNQYKTLYFFSIDPASTPQSLNKENLKAAYPDNHKFHDALDAQITTDAELYAFDKFHKMSKVNWILKNNMY